MAKEKENKTEAEKIVDGNRFVGSPEEFEFVGMEEDVIVFESDEESEE